MHNYNDLVNMLNIPFSSNNTNKQDHLISLLTDGITASGSGKKVIDTTFHLRQNFALMLLFI